MAEREEISRKGAKAQRRTLRNSLALITLLLLPLSIWLPAAFSQAETSSPQPTVTPTPSPSPSPTPPPNLHQWGAVTLFHGLPSDRVRAIAQTPDGLLWFATDGGLAKYDGRRIQAVTDDALPAGRVLALKLGAGG